MNGNVVCQRVCGFLERKRQRGFVRDPYRALAAAAVIQAVVDLRSRDPARRLSAWIFWGDLPLWLEGIGVDAETIELEKFLPRRRGRKKKIQNNRNNGGIKNG